MGFVDSSRKKARVQGLSSSIFQEIREL
ncbi:hypothetical protein CCACVL1_04419 [Corchorus capsularis]|uniref:Uncharacterized protein n=1 Tax=Corchorus capsularis TaxID=210143 RepID=A0A1R3JSK9_COCAP|nr:hypothetical protein CCACVL1_04419 [Corchorus capsularis]